MSQIPATDPLAPLRSALKGSSRERANAADLLGGLALEVPEAFTALVSLLRDRDVSVRLTAATAFERIGGAAVPGLLATLEEADIGQRQALILCLGKMGPNARHALPHLEKLREDAAVAAEADRALKAIQGEAPANVDRKLLLAAWITDRLLVLLQLVLPVLGLMLNFANENPGLGLTIAVWWAVICGTLGAVIGGYRGKGMQPFHDGMKGASWGTVGGFFLGSLLAPGVQALSQALGG